MLTVLDKFNNVAEYRRLISDTRGKNFTSAFGVHQNEKPFIASSFDRFVVYVTSDYVEAQSVLRHLNALRGGFVFVPHREDVLLFRQSYSKNGVYQRNGALCSILGGLNGVVICPEMLMQPVLPRSFFESNSFVLQTGNEIDLKLLAKKLVSAGFCRVESISSVGEFTVRGDIVEIFAPEPTGRVRLDFWGDQIESVKAVAEDGTSRNALDSVLIFPVCETQGADETVMEKAKKMAREQKLSPDSASRLEQIISQLSVATSGGVVDSLWLAPFIEQGKFVDYLPQDAVIIWDEPKKIAERVKFLYSEQDNRIANLLPSGEILPIHVSSLLDRISVYDNFKDFAQTSFQSIAYGATFFSPKSIFNFHTGAVSTYNQQDLLKKDVANWLLSGYELCVFAGNSEAQRSVAEQMRSAGIYLSTEEKLGANEAEGLILPITLERGFISHTNKLVVLGVRDIGRHAGESQIGKNTRQAFLSVEKGDYVVHDFHGIGLCEGIIKLNNGMGEKDYISVLYKNGDHLYVPVENSNLLSRYSGGENPTLSRLGGQEFEKVKNKVRESIKEMSIDLLALYAEREKPRGFSYKIDSYLDEEFARSFPFKETPDQIKCIEEIKSDLLSKRIMDRVLVGDVGYGKTEVAMRTAFSVVANGKQVAVMVPTTILAEQHYATFLERMKPFNVEVRCASRFRDEKELKKIIQDTKDGKVDVLIGTHRLLSADVEFASLGLLILDEEQRFGVEHKEHVKDIKRQVDVLTLSATPIPRTLHMALSGIRDISTITTPPVERVAVSTFVSEESTALVRDVILREIGRGGQVFFLYNRVQTITSFAGKIAQLVPEAKIVVAHGQMDENALEDAIFRFQQGEFNVLVCTTIIENGIDIPNANTLIVYDADNLGLSQLYQLRGRVGRSDKPAYAYFLYREGKILSETAFKRLSSITEYTELGSGFKIAMKDLEIRGAGNVLGKEQHGHMVKVGYDMYAKLLKETVAKLKGEKVEEERQTQIEIDFDAYAPDSYVASATERMDFYRNLASCKTHDEVDRLGKAVVEAYGSLPKQVVNLITVQYLKIDAMKAKVSKLTLKDTFATLHFACKEDMMRKEVFDALANEPQASVENVGFAITIRSFGAMEKQRLVAVVQNFLQSVANS